MPEYIERETLLADIDACVRITTRPDKPSAELRGASKVISRIEAIPAVDVVPVVRCGECKYRQYDALFHQSYCNGNRVTDDWYCADGVRLTNCGARMDGDGE